MCTQAKTKYTCDSGWMKTKEFGTCEFSLTGIILLCLLTISIIFYAPTTMNIFLQNVILSAHQLETLVRCSKFIRLSVPMCHEYTTTLSSCWSLSTKMQQQKVERWTDIVAQCDKAQCQHRTLETKSSLSAQPSFLLMPLGTQPQFGALHMCDKSRRSWL